MNIVKMAFWNFRTNLRNYSPLFLSLGFSVLVLFNFLTILFTDVFSAVGEPDTGRINYVIEAGVFILGCFMIFYIGYSATVFLAKHKKESGVYVVMGLSNERVGRLYMAEIFMTGLAVLVSGIFFGMLTTPLFQMILGAVSDIEVELTFQFAAEPFFITTGIFLLLYSVFAVRGYRNIVRSSVFDMIPAAMTRDRIMVRPKGLVYRTVSGIGILSAGYYLSVKRGGAEAAGTFCMSAILMLWGIYLVFGGLIPLLFSSLADNKLFLYRKERTLWINNVAWRMKKNYRTYATACMLMLCAVMVLTAGFAVKERYKVTGIIADCGTTGWIKIPYAIAIWIFLVFAAAGGSAILMKAFSDALEERERYVLLRKMGLDSEILGRSITRELRTIYICPFVLTVISSYFSISALEKLTAVDLRSIYFVSLFIIFLLFMLLYLLSVTLYRRNAGNE